jgi:parallel beta-helix repeat protein
MEKFKIMLWGILAIALGIGGSGCHYAEQVKILIRGEPTFTGEYRVDPSLGDRPPQTVAVLPFLNKTGREEAFNIVRQSFHGHFSKLNYVAVPLLRVDHALREAGLDTPEKIAQTPLPKLSEIIGTDAVIRGEITSYERLYVGVYSQVSVGAEIQMVDGKTGKELWWAKDTSRKHGGGISTTPVGLILTALVTTVNMRSIELLRSSDDLFRDMITTIPQPTLAQILRPPNITILVHDGMRRTDRPALKVGGLIRVAMEGDSRKRAAFKIGDFKTNLPMGEEKPGVYTGSYKVLPGDNTEASLIIGVLTDDQGNSTEWVDALGAVAIDTASPNAPGGLKARGRDKLVHLSWARNTDKDLASYKIYRSPTPLTGYHEMATTELTAFQDQNVVNEMSYYYRLSAIDLAGNESTLSDPIRATPVTPGPTAVKGVLNGEIVWLAEASPYVIEGEVVVNHEATLTIEPGTVVRSRGEGISVLGKLIARGNRQSMITFEPNEPNKEWKGIVFSGTSGEESAIEFSKITGADVGITCLSSSPLIVSNDLSKNQVGLLISESFSKPRIRGNLISGNALSGVEIAAGAAPLLEENEIWGNKENGILSKKANPDIRKNRILNNGEAGIRLLSSSALLTQNNIHNNMKYDLYNSPENDIPVEANENWWGTTEVLKLIVRIYGRVDYQRVLDAPFPQGKPLDLPILKSPLGGLVGKDSFLTLVHSPYILEKSVVIDEGATLFIEAGVILKFNPGSSLIVRNGGVEARGTPDRVVTFTSNSSSPSPGSFPAAVRFERPTQVASSFRYCLIEFAKTGLEILYGAPDIHHCLITQNEHVGIKVTNEGAPSIFFSTFANNAGAGAIVVLGSARPKIYRNNFQENPFAIQSLSPIYLDARENWWGESPPSQSLFLGPINLEPWLDRPEPEAFIGRKP